MCAGPPPLQTKALMQPAPDALPDLSVVQRGGRLVGIADVSRGNQGAAVRNDEIQEGDVRAGHTRFALDPAQPRETAAALHLLGTAETRTGRVSTQRKGREAQ